MRDSVAEMAVDTSAVGKKIPNMHGTSPSIEAIHLAVGSLSQAHGMHVPGPVEIGVSGKNCCG